MADPKSWNPWHGCKKYSEGCAHCYMYALDEIRGVGERSPEITRTASFRKPLEKNRAGKYKIPAGYELRVNMTSDTFLAEADSWREEMWDIIRARPDVRFYILTKRAERIAENLPSDWGEGWENVSLNISCENERTFEKRWGELAKIPAKHKGFNLAPLIGEIDATPALESGQIELVYCGGESYGGTRLCRFEWVKSLSEACEKRRVNFFFVSTGERFEFGGRIYHMRSKRVQALQAYRSGLSRFFGAPKYRLFDLEDGRELGADELASFPYNEERCASCAIFEICLGCVSCGNCPSPRLAPKERIREIRAAERK